MNIGGGFQNRFRLTKICGTSVTTFTYVQMQAYIVHDKYLCKFYTTYDLYLTKVVVAGIFLFAMLTDSLPSISDTYHVLTCALIWCAYSVSLRIAFLV